LHSCYTPTPLHSFPTRRSSDLFHKKSSSISLTQVFQTVMKLIPYKITVILIEPNAPQLNKITFLYNFFAKYMSLLKISSWKSIEEKLALFDCTKETL